MKCLARAANTIHPLPMRMTVPQRVGLAATCTAATVVGLVGVTQLTADLGSGRGWVLIVASGLIMYLANRN